MSKLLLVTTALKAFPENDKPTLFLGEWCRLYSEKDQWKNLDAQVVQYHWNDRKKLYKDYKYLIQLFERILGEHLAIELNKFHEVSYSTLLENNNWTMVIKFFVYYFRQVVKFAFALANYPITNTNFRRS